MKKSKGKEGKHPHLIDEAQEKNSTDNVMVFLVLATLLLAVSTFSSISLSFFHKEKIFSENKSEKYVWISGSSTLSDGLYVFTQEMLEEKLPELVDSDVSATGINGSEQTVLAFQFNDDHSPGAANLPPEIANIFFRPVSLNRASKNILSTLPGIGPVLAERIVQWRKENGPFRSFDELLRIKGIGPGKLANLIEHIFID